MTGHIATFRRRLLDWYARNRRQLPWRLPADAPLGTRPDPYHVLVSEAMLQQTQVATAVPYYLRFLRRFPTVSALAWATDQQVLRTWQGLGYYSRAVNLRRAAREVVARFGGEIPSSVAELLTLPGVGLYTAGAVASIAFGVRAPAVDGNVTRVLCRLDRIDQDPRSPSVQRRLWSRAAELVPARHPGEFNSALMELGAIVCVSKSPRCLICPVIAHCEAKAQGVEAKIPAARKSTPRPTLRRSVLCLWRIGKAGPEFLIERRPANGRWARMWQFVTFDPGQTLDGWAKLLPELGRFNCPPRQIAVIRHQLTHRRYEFRVFAARAAQAEPARPPRRWVRLEQIARYPLPRPHVMILEQLGAVGISGSSGKGAAKPAARTLAAGQGQS